MLIATATPIPSTIFPQQQPPRGNPHIQKMNISYAERERDALFFSVHFAWIENI
jgi:hypothetical protein